MSDTQRRPTSGMPTPISSTPPNPERRVAMGIDLGTGKERETTREDYCMKIAAVAPGGDCPLWLKFLDQVTDGGRELQAYLQRMAGYCMTGHTSEHVFFFLYGTGANGKSVFVNTLLEIW